MNNNFIIGHRGAAAYAPENTLVSFQKAKDLGCNFIEFDVVQSQDGELFVFHDEYLHRTSNGSGAVAKRDAAYIKSLDAGSWFASEYKGVKIPTLKETLVWLVKNDMQANIEIKPTDGKILDITTAVIQELKLYWPANRPLPIISSFNYEALVTPVRRFFTAYELIPLVLQ